MTMRALLMTTAVFALISAGGRAATVITLSQSADGDTGTQTMIMDGDKLRITSDEGDMIYRGDQGKVFIVDTDSKSYMEMSPETMQAMKARMDQAMAHMKQQMASMPEAQRQQMEAMMAQRGMPLPGQPPAPPPQVTYQKSGAARTVGKWSCAPYTTLDNGKPQADLCLAKIEDVGLTQDDLKPLVGMSAFMSKQAAQMGGQPPAGEMDFDALKKAVGYAAFPVQTMQTIPSGPGGPGGPAGGKVESTVQSVEHKDVPAGTFDLPAGYKKREMGAQGPGGGE
jgi:hypothetical protein